MNRITITLTTATDRTTLRAVAQELAEDAIESLSDQWPDRSVEVHITEGVPAPQHESAYFYDPAELGLDFTEAS